MPIHYSVGQGATDSRPVPALAKDFTDYRRKVEALRKNICISPEDTKNVLSAKKKRLYYLWGPMRDTRHGRRAVNAGDRDVVWLDMDGCAEADWPALRNPASQYLGFAYTTSSHLHPTANNEHRWRLCFALSRRVPISDYKRLCEAIEQTLMKSYRPNGAGPVKWDRSVYDLDHMVYAPHESATFVDFSGGVIDVDRLLSGANDGQISKVSDNSKGDVLPLITRQTFDDLRSAMWHPAVLADAKPQSGRYNAWVSMGCRLAGFRGSEFEDQARALWLEWSADGGGDAADIREAERRWDDGKLSADRTGFRAVFARAQQAGWQNPASGGSRLFPVACVEDYDPLQPGGYEQPRSLPHSGGYGEPGIFIVEGLLPAGITMFYGPSSSFKSYCIVSILCRIAMKTHRWAGRNIKGGAVLYVAAEGGSSVLPRIGAWSEKYNAGSPVPLFYTYAYPVDLAVPAKVGGLIEEIKRIEMHTGESLRVVVIDTLSQSMMQGDENSASDVARFMAGATRVFKETGAAVAIVHHSGKDSSKGMRGSSAAFANADAVIRVERFGDAVNLINEKQRTGPTQPVRSYLVPAVPLPEAVIGSNEAHEGQYTSIEGDLYHSARLTTERVFEDVPLARIDLQMIDKSLADNNDSTDESWVRRKLESAGGSISRSELRTLWRDETSKSAGQFRTVLGRMKVKNYLTEHHSVIKDVTDKGRVTVGGEHA